VVVFQSGPLVVMRGSLTLTVEFCELELPVGAGANDGVYVGIWENALRGVDVVGEVAVAEFGDGGEVSAAVAVPEMVETATEVGPDGEYDRGGSKGVPCELHAELVSKMQRVSWFSTQDYHIKLKAMIGTLTGNSGLRRIYCSGATKGTSTIQTSLQCYAVRCVAYTSAWISRGWNA